MKRKCIRNDYGKKEGNRQMNVREEGVGMILVKKEEKTTHLEVKNEGKAYDDYE